MPISLRILVISDVAMHQTELSRLLFARFSEATIVQCRTSAAAIMALRAKETDIVLIHRAADMGTDAFIESLRHIDAGIPIILIAATEEMARMESANIDAVVLPESWESLGDLFAELISSRKYAARFRKQFPQLPFNEAKSGS